MSWVRATPRLVSQFAGRHPWWFTAASIVFWTLLSPLALLWLVVYLVDRFRALDKRPEARRQRRVARLLRWYPADWRARYGDEMAALLDDAMAARRAGPRLSLNLAKEGMATRLAPPGRRDALAVVCLSLCWLPLVPQGIVAAVMKSIGTPTRSWFVALHAPNAYQWPLIAAMTALGVVMLGAGMILVRGPARLQPE